MWAALIILYFIFGAASYVLRRELAQKLPEHNRVINVIFFVIFLLPTGIILSFFFPHDLNVGTMNLAFLLGGSIIWPIFYIIAFNANKEVDAGIFAIIGNVSPIFTVGIALLFLHESLSVHQSLGIGLLILSGTLAATSQLHMSRSASINGILLCLLAASVSGVAIAYERFMLTRVDFGAYLIYGWGAQIAWSVILAHRELKNLPTILSAKDTRQTLLAWGASSTLRSVAFIIALNISSASLVSGASDFMSVAVVIAAYFYLKEREHLLYKSIAAAIGIAGLLLIAG